MTDEEIAEKYTHSHTYYKVAKREDGTEYAKEVSSVTIKQAFLAGLKAGKDMTETDLATIAYMQGAERYKLEWHKVADGDLPNNCRYVWTNEGAGYYDGDEWWDDSSRLQNVIAWCEPEYEEYEE